MIVPMSTIKLSKAERVELTRRATSQAVRADGARRARLILLLEAGDTWAHTKTGEVLGKTAARHTSAEFVAFLTDIVVNQPRGKEIHVIADNLSAHKAVQVKEFLEAHCNVHLHFTPTYSSWLNQVELWFSKIERDVIARGVFTQSVI